MTVKCLREDGCSDAIVHGLTIFSSASIEYAKSKPEYEDSTDRVLMINLHLGRSRGKPRAKGHEK